MASKRRKHRRRIEWTLPAGEVVDALEERAEDLAAENQHALVAWQSAKRKYGKGARRNWCKDCDAEVLVLPYGTAKGRTRHIRTAPAIAGEAVEVLCVLFEGKDPGRDRLR